MANFADSAAGRVAAEDLVKTRMASKAWLVGHQAVNAAGNTIVRFIRPMSASNPTYGAWTESRSDSEA